MRIDRATARRIAEALASEGVGHKSCCKGDYCVKCIDGMTTVIFRASAPTKPPGRTKRGKKGRAE